MRTIDVRLADRSYPIHIRAGLLSRASGELDKIGASRRLWMLTDSNVAETHGRAVRASLKSGGHSVDGMDFISNESMKSSSGLS